MSGRKGRRGFGRIRKLPSGRWQASYVAPDLRRTNAPITFLTKADAEGVSEATVRSPMWRESMPSHSRTPIPWLTRGPSALPAAS